MKVDFNAQAKRVGEEYGLNKSDYFKASEGENRFRLMSPMLPYEGYYKGIKNFKMLCYVIDRKDETIKPYFMPYSIFKMIGAYQKNPEYAFEEVPMPYDLTLTAKNAGTKEVEYSLMAARTSTPVTSEEKEALGNKTGISDLKAQLDEKNRMESQGQENQGQSTQQVGEPEVKEVNMEESKPESKITAGDVPF